MDIKQLFKKGQKFAGAKGLVFIDDSWVLVFERDDKTDFYPNCHDLPGGCVEPHETPFETFQRELYEEFGVNVSPDEIMYSVKRPDLGLPAREVYFVVADLKHATRKQIRFSDEGRGYKVVHLDQVLKDLEFIPGYLDFIKEYLEYAETQRQPQLNHKGTLASHLGLPA